MGKITAWLGSHIRAVIQTIATILSNGYIRGFFRGKIYQGKLKGICIPGLNCYSCPGALGACPIGSLQRSMSMLSTKVTTYVIGSLMIFGGFFGRYICGYVCPFGFLQDLLYKIPFFKKVKNLAGHKWLKNLRYVVLIIFVIILPIFFLDTFGQAIPWFCKWICPQGTLEGGWILGLLDPSLQDAMGWLFTWKSTLLILILILSLYSYRPFCKYLCPLGGIYGLFNPIAFFRYKVLKTKCTSCNACYNVCPCEINPSITPNSADCIRCGKCLVVCPTNALVKTSVIKERKKDE